MSIIELLVYIALLSTFLAGSIFSAYSMLISVSHDSEKADQKSVLNQGENPAGKSGGFVAIISAITISAALLLVAITLSDKTASLYSSVMKSEYRLLVRARTYACFDRALMKLSQDYFYTTPSGTSELVDVVGCSIDSVSSTTATTRSVSVSAFYNDIHGKLTADVSMGSNNIQILHKDFIIF